LLVEGVDLDGNGAPVGTLRETAAKDLILNAIPSDGGVTDKLAISWAQRELLSQGITSVLDAWVDMDLAENYISAAKKGLLGVMINLAFWLEPSQWQSQLSEASKSRRRVDELADEHLSASTVKLFIDGVFGSATAFVTEPYLSSGQHGSRLWTPEQLQEVCERASEFGFQLHLHAIGDAAVGAALDALELCSGYWLQGDNRPPVMAHVELISDADLTRLAQLGVGVNVQPLWSRPDDLLNSCRRHLGDRVDRLYRTRDMIDGGVTVAFGSDWPVSSVNPFLGLYTAVKRSMPGGSQTQNPEQAISLEQALHAYTYEGSKQLGLFGCGTLEPGQRADFLILSDDPFENPESLPGMFVLETISGGQTRFTRH
jgi:predicted amidohydrolase YtcJ